MHSNDNQQWSAATGDNGFLYVLYTHKHIRRVGVLMVGAGEDALRGPPHRPSPVAYAPSHPITRPHQGKRPGQAWNIVLW